MHVAGAVVLAAFAPSCEPARPSVGSDGLDVDLVAPRLAPPLEPYGERRRDPGRALAAARPRDLGAAQDLRAARGPDDDPPPRFEAPGRARAGPAAAQRRAAAASRGARLVPPAPAAAAKRGRTEQGLTSMLGGELPEAIPGGPSLTAIARSVDAEARERRERHARALAEKRRQDAALDARYDELVQRTAAQARAMVGGSARASGERGAGAADADPAAARSGGATPLYGLKFYLSGRRVHTSRVVRPPELISMPRVGCKVRQLSTAPATVRMLVDRQGKAAHAYVKRSSGSQRFDRCALTHARRMAFKPGIDSDGQALDVWINVRVEPSTIGAASASL